MHCGDQRSRRQWRSPRVVRQGEAPLLALPEALIPLFHNYEADTIAPRRDATLVILTVLSKGGWRQIEALFALYGAERIEATVHADLNGLHMLPDITANFWSIVFWGLPLKRRSLVEKWSPTRTIPQGSGER